MLNPYLNKNNLLKTHKVDRLTPEQLKIVFNPPEKKHALEVLKEGLYNKRGEEILLAQIARDKKKLRKLPITEEEKKRRKKLMEQKLKEKRRNLWEDYWSSISASRVRYGAAAISLPTTIGSMIVGVNWRIWRP